MRPITIGGYRKIRSKRVVEKRGLLTRRPTGRCRPGAVENSGAGIERFRRRFWPPRGGPLRQANTILQPLRWHTFPLHYK